MYIELINWIDEENREAEVVVSDGMFTVSCFSHPFNGKIGTRLNEPIYCLDAENIVIAKDKVSFAKNAGSVFAYSICGKLVERKDNLVLLGNIQLCLEDAHIPGDIDGGSFIEFDVARLSIY